MNKTRKNRHYKKRSFKKRKTNKRKTKKFKKSNNKVYYANEIEKAAYLLSKKNKGSIKSGSKKWKETAASALETTKDFLTPQLIKDMTESANQFKNIPKLIQNQVTIFLYAMKDLPEILIHEDSEEYIYRNNRDRVRKILHKLYKSEIFRNHLLKRDLDLRDIRTCEEIWQIMQEEVISKTIQNFMYDSLQNRD